MDDLLHLVQREGAGGLRPRPISSSIYQMYVTGYSHVVLYNSNYYIGLLGNSPANFILFDVK